MLMGKFNKRCERGIYQSLFSEHLPFLDRCTIQHKEKCEFGRIFTVNPVNVNLVTLVPKGFFFKERIDKL